MRDPEGSPIVPLPKGLAVMEPYRRAVQFAQKLSVGVDYARFDFLWNGAELFGGEITIYPAAGMLDPANSSVNAVTMTGWDLMQSHFLKSQHTGWMRIYADALSRRLKESVPVPVRRIQARRSALRNEIRCHHRRRHHGVDGGVLPETQGHSGHGL